ncbi:hypothetical protein HX436_002072 [Salmonella enterica subsp. enterica serovar Montevideo]|nr:hypothetical protein [Salmonella enterica subsp. enterica serovar Montevideo]
MVKHDIYQQVFKWLSFGQCVDVQLAVFVNCCSPWLSVANNQHSWSYALANNG